MADIEKINDLVAQKEFKNAKELVDIALKENAQDKELIKLAGLVYVNLELWKNAQDFFETIIKFEPNDATSWFYLASCYEKLGNHTASKNAYINVIDLRPEYMDAYQSLCVVALKLNDTQTAINYAQKAIEFDPENYLYDFIIGTSYMKEKEFEKATEPLKTSLTKMPNNLSTINSLGTCYMAQNQIDLAIETYQKAIELNPNNAMTYYNIGSAYQILQKHDLACEYLQKAVDIDEDESCLASLALSEVKLEQYEKALKHYKQLAVLCPSKETYKFNIVVCYEALNEYQAAISLLEELVYVNPKSTLPAQKLANLYIRTNNPAKAKEIYDNFLLKGSMSAESMHQYAVISSSLCDTETAEKMLKKAIRLNPDFAKAHKDLGIIYLNKRLFDYAEDEFKTALKLAPNDFEIIFEYGNFLYSISKNQEAEVYYREALEVDPENVLALTFMGLNKLILNELDEAYSYIMKAYKNEPNHEYVQFCVGRILYARGEHEDAKRYLIRAVEQNPDVETQNTLALTYFKLGEYQLALNIFRNIQVKNPKSISVLMDIARCQEALNDNDGALKTLDKIIEIFPDYEDAHEMIRKLS